jgi:hypothetical protein
MTSLFVAMADTLAVVRRRNGHWQADLQLTEMPVQCVAADPLRPERLYCGTFGKGLWRSDDAGASWQPVGEGIPYAQIMAVAVSTLERAGGYGVVWAGTEPSALFRSEDGGATWQERPTLRELPSAPTWSFPPRPYTHHVRWIQPDPHVAKRLFVSIEMGGVMRSLDAGLTWEDRKPDGPRDAHTLRMHRLAPNRLYAAAGDGLMRPGNGYAESDNGGATWQQPDEGLHHHYLWGLALDPGNPDTILISAATDPGHAHDPNRAESTLYRRTAGGPWQEVCAGLPPSQGRLAAALAANESEPGVFYTGTQDGLYRSADAGRNWEPLAVVWPENAPAGRMHDIVVTETA